MTPPATATAMAQPTAPGSPPVHWAVRMNHRNRTGCSLIVLVLVGLQLHALQASLWPWLMAFLYFLLYPQLVYRVALRVREPLHVETWGMRIDALVLGLWTGLVQVPLWMAVALWVSATLHPVVFRGPRGFAESAGLLAAGTVFGIVANGGQVQLETNPAVTVVSIAFLAVYLLILTFDAYGRAATLAEVRRKLRNSEQSLQQRLVEIEYLQTQLREQANRDPLTGVYNRRYLDATLGRELAQARRGGKDLSLLLLDIDHFKRINDDFGHPAGDEVLRHSGTLLQTLSRQSDLVCRYGGEEFLLLLPDTGPAGAREQAEKIRRTLQSRPVAFENQAIDVRASIGVATLNPDLDTPETLIGRADRALYAAKNAGRNQVMVHGTF
jgi:diguanylate cyclase (GGDEF)-like protein